MQQGARSVVRALRRRRSAFASACTLVALVSLAVAARVLWTPTPISVASDFPARPARLAHLLADISSNTHPIPGNTWSLEEESGNYTSWRYAVSYVCGARCAGRMAVEAHDLTKDSVVIPRHGVADAHRVVVRSTECTSLPLLPWPQLCDEMQTVFLVTAVGSGSRLQEFSEARCGVGATLLGGCPRADATAMRQRADERARRLGDLLRR